METKKWLPFIDGLNYHPLFVTVSGAHIYGFPSPDSDVDLRGCHQLSLDKVVGLNLPKETLDRTDWIEGTEVDIVSHEVGKYFRLLVKNNGYVLEQIFSPLVVTGHEFLERLKPIANRCITRFHAKHYLGFFATQFKLLQKEPVKKAKSLLYAYRVLMTGIHLMRTGRIETHVLVLNEQHQFGFLEELIAAKETEHVKLATLDWESHAARLLQLEKELNDAFEETSLPVERDAQAVNELLIELRLGQQAR